jgi:hypothetical protein
LHDEAGGACGAADDDQRQAEHDLRQLLARRRMMGRLRDAWYALPG